MKYIIVLLVAWIGIPGPPAESLYVCKNVKINLYSKAPIEDIEATSTKGTSVYNSATGELVFSVPIRSFQFEKALMQEHFNENYMESDKYPQASFKGKVQEHIDVNKDGAYPVNVTGVLDVHGIKQTRAITGSINVHNGTLTIVSEFIVKCADHQIAIPTIVFHNIGETIRIQVTGTYDSYKK